MDREIQLKIERVYDIIVTRLQAKYLETFGIPLEFSDIKTIFKTKLEQAKRATIDEAFRHLSAEDLFLADTFIFPEPDKEPELQTEPVKVDKSPRGRRPK